MFILQVVDAIISHGCFLQECLVQRSIVGERSRLNYGVELKVNYHNFQNEYFEDLFIYFSMVTWFTEQPRFVTGYHNDGCRQLPN